VWGWRLAALRGPAPYISPWPSLPAIRPGRSARFSAAAPPRPAAVGLGDASPFSRTVERDGNWSRSGGVRARRQASSSPLASLHPPGRVLAWRQHSPVRYSLRYNRHQMLEACAGGFSCAISAFQQHFRPCATLGRSGGAVWAVHPGGSSSRVSPLVPLRQRPPAETGRVGALSFCSRQAALSSAGAGSPSLIWLCRSCRRLGSGPSSALHRQKGGRCRAGKRVAPRLHRAAVGWMEASITPHGRQSSSPLRAAASARFRCPAVTRFPGPLPRGSTAPPDAVVVQRWLQHLDHSPGIHRLTSAGCRGPFPERAAPHAIAKLRTSEDGENR